MLTVHTVTGPRLAYDPAPPPPSAPVVEERPDPTASRIAQLEGEVRRLTADRDGLLAERDTWREQARSELLRDLERYAGEKRSFLAAPGPVASLGDDRSAP